jgi:putative ABC transport system permease protein
LLVACANVANLLLARAIDRRKELALRRALGASRSRLVRQLLTEAFLLAMLAGGVGVVASYILTGAIVHAGGVPAAISSTLWIDLRVLVATSVLAMLTTVVFGLAPALFGSNLALAPTLKDEAASTGPARRRPRLRNSLIVAQVTASVVLIVVAALLLQSIAKALKVEPGFDIKRGATLSFDLGLQGYGPDARAAFIARLLAAVEAMPEVESAALADVLPLSGSMFGTQITANDAKTGDGVSASFANVTAGYFRTLGIPLLRGRDFTRHESTGSAPLAIVNETLARRLWANRDPIGQRVRVGGPGEAVREVIGVARDGRYDNLGESPRGFVYMPQGPSPITGLSLVTRTRSDPGAAIAPLRRILQGLDPNLPVYRAWTLEQSMRETLDKQRAASALVGVFGLLTLALAALGIYSVTSHAVTLRTREIGIRMALGAARSKVLRLVLREAAWLAVLGAALGLPSGYLLGRVIEAQLFAVRAHDPLTFVLALLSLLAAALLAGYLPAARAARVDPMVALRYE